MIFYQFMRLPEPWLLSEKIFYGLEAICKIYPTYKVEENDFNRMDRRRNV